MKLAVGELTLITKTSVELPTSVRVDFTRLIEFTQITLTGPVLVIVLLAVMSPKVWVHGRAASVAERARAAALSGLRFWLKKIPPVAWKSECMAGFALLSTKTFPNTVAFSNVQVPPPIATSPITPGLVIEPPPAVLLRVTQFKPNTAYLQ